MGDIEGVFSRDCAGGGCNGKPRSLYYPGIFLTGADDLHPRGIQSHIQIKGRQATENL